MDLSQGVVEMGAVRDILNGIRADIEALPADAPKSRVLARATLEKPHPVPDTYADGAQRFCALCTWPVVPINRTPPRFPARRRRRK